ncbi:Hsp70 family protein [Dactylosporangium sp. NPDC051541]|uniref:Hsp70 family protein n=1 Tax=Dactylosporangium sp. NPDC051541 TaxID=3363977 RepID=UPI0037A2A608
MTQIVGIDLGTTYSAVAVVNEFDQPEVLTNRDGESITPSVVLFQGDVPLVGTMAKRAATTAPLDVVEFVKRAMGDPAWRFDATDGRTYRPEEVSALIVKRLKEDAELALGAPVTEAVITVPAYFDDAQRQATRDAGRIAGVDVVRVLNEPTAAAIAYGLASGFNGSILVYDLGGGTFDVTILRIDGAQFDILGTDGDRNLGGFDWDGELMRLLNERFVAAGGEDLLDGGELEAALRERAVLAKHSLSSVEKARVVLSGSAAPITLEVTRDDFEAATSALLSRTREMAEMVRDNAGLAWTDIDRVLLVGGSTRMPMVRRMVETDIGRPIERRIHPDEIVALGAAVQARLIESERGAAPDLTVNGARIEIGDVTSHGLGTLALNPDSGRLENTVIIPHNTKIPAKRPSYFSTVHENQSQVEIQVTIGDDTDPGYVRNATGDKPLMVRIPPYPAGAPIEVIYAYDIDQTVFVEVNDLTAHTSLGTFEVSNIANMSKNQVAEAADKMRTTEVG